MEKSCEAKLVQFKFISDSYSKYLECPLCKKMLIQPMRLHPCGHTFCKTCIQKQQTQNSNSKSKTCYHKDCKKRYTAVQQDITAGRLIDQLKVKCLNDGCPWKGDYEEYRKYHAKECKLKDGLDNWLKSLVKGISKQNQQSQQKESQKQENKQTNQKQPQQFVKTIKSPINQKNQKDQKEECQQVKIPLTLNQNNSYISSIFSSCSQMMNQFMKKIVAKPNNDRSNNDKAKQ